LLRLAIIVAAPVAGNGVRFVKLPLADPTFAAPVNVIVKLGVGVFVAV